MNVWVPEGSRRVCWGSGRDLCTAEPFSDSLANGFRDSSCRGARAHLVLLFPAVGEGQGQGQGPKAPQALLLSQMDPTGLVLLHSVHTSSERLLPLELPGWLWISVISEAPDLLGTGGKSQRCGEVSHSQWLEEKEAL